MLSFVVALAAAAFLFWLQDSSSNNPWKLVGGAALVVLAGIGASTVQDRATELFCQVPILSARCERPATLFLQ